MKTKAFLTWSLGIIGALALVLSPASFAADATKETSAPPVATNAPADLPLTKETAKAAVLGDRNPLEALPLTQGMKPHPTTGGVDPHGDSLLSIQHSFQQFAHLEFMLRLFLSLTLAVGCAAMIGWDPRRAKKHISLATIEECKTLIILGVVGAIVAELSQTSPTLAFVIFGIGALLRFRTVLDNPKATGKAILVVVIGLACGMGSWTMAVFVTLFSWALLFWLDSHLTGNLVIRLSNTRDTAAVQHTVESLLLAHRCRPRSCTFTKGRKRVEFVFHLPAGLDQDKLEADLKAGLPKNGETRLTLEVG